MNDAVYGIILNLAANVAWALTQWLWSRYRSRERAQRHRRDVVLGFSTGIASILVVALLLVWQLAIEPSWGWIAVISAVGWEGWLLGGELRRFWRVGVQGADIQTRQGIDYDASLRLVTNELSFMGTGAHKLTRSKEFEGALGRCRPDETIRLLLRRPGDDVLAAAERRAGEPPGSYSDQVVSSLRLLAVLHNSFPNLEVRFYEDEAIFRIMLIDARYALVSYNVYGQGDGSDLPQLHLAAAADRHSVKESFYHAFDLYFTKVWNSGVTWDFVSHTK
jgi:hypothetical protein